MTRALVVAATLAATACSPRLMKLPVGSGSVATLQDATAALAQATEACAKVRTLTAEVAVSGSVSGQRVRGRLSVGVAAPASARVEAVAPFGPPVFIFTAVGDDATIFLPRDERMLEHGRPDAVLEAIAGIPLDAADLDRTLTGCDSVPSVVGGGSTATQFGATWLAFRSASSDVYLRRGTATEPWEVVSAERRSSRAGVRWRAEYADRQNGIPRSIRLISLDDAGRSGRAFDLRLALSQVEIDTPLDADVFAIVVHGNVKRMTLDELRRSGAFGVQ